MSRAFSWLILCLSLCGCRVSAPIHLWQPPQLASTVGKKVVVSAVVGPEKLSGPIKEQLLATAPKDIGRATSLVDAERLPSSSEIQLVSATDEEPSDVALASAARESGAEFTLRGEVLSGRDAPTRPDDSTLRLSWRLTPLTGDDGATGMPVVVHSEEAIERYPDLALVNDDSQRLTTAAVRDTYRLITPWIDRQQTQLAQPILLPGSREVRRGNRMARAGRWGEAEQIWQRVWDGNPTQVAALHNLALAAAAGQDFSRAKQLARRAIRMRPTSLYKNTLVWIELMQRDYHQAFDLPDPPEGWYVTHRDTP